jgi:hypothetical protein
MPYTVEANAVAVPVRTYLNECVVAGRFLHYCRECSNCNTGKAGRFLSPPIRRGNAIPAAPCGRDGTQPPVPLSSDVYAGQNVRRCFTIWRTALRIAANA